jgi:valyl-tRNA synthetase
VVDLEAERTRIGRAVAGIEADLAKVEAKLGNSAFVDKAPPEVVEKERSKQAEFRGLLDKLRTQLDAL